MIIAILFIYLLIGVFMSTVMDQAVKTNKLKVNQDVSHGVVNVKYSYEVKQPTKEENKILYYVSKNRSGAFIFRVIFWAFLIRR